MRIKCDECNGTGRVYGGRKCYECHGEGTISMCEGCDGFGTVNSGMTVCPHCNGQGDDPND